MTPATLDCEAPKQRSQAVQRGAELLRRGGLVVFPTETVYGVGACVTKERGMKRLRELKSRGAGKPFSVHIPDAAAVGRYVELSSSALLRRLVAKTLPGPITIIAEADEATIERKLGELGLPPDARNLLYHDHTIGLRCPDHPVASELLGAVSSPVVASSANRAKQPPPADAEAARNALDDKVDVILDGGPSRHSKASTIVKVTSSGLEVIREGVFDKRYLEKIITRRLLFVCSGNTCRSPMAERLARVELARRLGTKPDRLADHGWVVSSAGAYALADGEMTPEARQAMEKLDVPSPAHQARALSAEMINQAERVFCMTESHRRAVLAVAPDAAPRTQRLDPAGDVEDPIGAGVNDYVQTARRIQQAISRRLDEMDL